MARQLLSKSIYAKNGGNGPPSADQDLSIAEPRHGHAVFTLRVHPPSSPCPALSAGAEPISQGHCRKSHDEAESIMTTFGAMGPKGLINLMLEGGPDSSQKLRTAKLDNLT